MTVTYSPFQSQSGFSSPGFIVGLNGAITTTSLDTNSLTFAGVELFTPTSLGNSIVTSSLTTVGTLTGLTVNSTTPVTINSTGAIVLSPGTVGSINNMSIGATIPRSGAFTTLTAPTITTTTLTASNNIFIGDINVKSYAAALAIALS